MQTRLEELGKLKRDMQARYAEAAARCAVRRESLQTLLSETDQLGRTASVSLEELERLEPDSWTEQNYSSELAAGMRKLENLRLELIRRQARVAEMENSCGAGNAVAEKAGFGVAEMASLSFLQLFRIGFYMLLPLLMILFAGAVLIAAAAYFSTRI